MQDSYSVTRIIDGRTFHLNLTGQSLPYPITPYRLSNKILLDTAGQEEYRGLWAAQNLEADAYLLVYDITSAESLAALDYFDDLIEMGTDERMSKSGAIPHVKIVAGNKCDLANSRQVTSAQGLAWAREHNCGYVSMSSSPSIC